MGKFAFDPDLASEAISSVAANGFSSDFSKPSDDSGAATDGFLSEAQKLGATRLWSPANLSIGDVNASANTMEDLLNTGTYATAGTSTSRFGSGNDVEIASSGLTANSLSKVLFVKAGAAGTAGTTANHVANNLQPTSTTGTWFFVMIMNPLLSLVANKSYGLKFFYFRDGADGSCNYNGKYSLFRHSFISGQEDQIKLDTAIGLGGTVSSETSAGVPGATGYVTISTNQVLSVAYINNGSGAEHYFQRTNYGGSYPEASATVGSPSGVENFERSVLAMGNYFQAAQFDGAGCMAAVFFPTVLTTGQLGALHAAIS